MSGPNFSYIRVELPAQDDDGRVMSKRSESVITVALTDDAQLRQMLALAHTLNEALDGVATEIAAASGLAPDSEQITDAVFNETDIDAAMAILSPKPEHLS